MVTQLPQKGGHSPQFLANVRCGQTAGWTKMPLGMEVGLDPGDVVLDGVAASIRPIREFREMPITDINVRTHPITDTDIRYEGYSVAVGLLFMPYSLPPPTSPILRNWLVALACGLPAFTRRLNGHQYTLLQSTNQKREAGWGDTVRKLSVLSLIHI